MADGNPGSCKKRGGEMKTVLEVKGLCKNYGDLKAVKDLSFSVARGEIFGIMGPNGAGKSTTLECILGTKKRDRGEVSLLGMDPVSARKEVFARTGVQFQDSAWQTGIRVEEILEATACLYENTRDCSELLREFDLEKRAKTAVTDLSGGERQKLSVLLACVHDPEVLFLDELTTGLDPVARRETWEFIKEIQKRGKTIILTSHFMDEVEYLCNRGIIIHKGEVLLSGPIDEIRGETESLEKAYISLVEGAVK